MRIFFPLCSPAGSTIFGGALPYLAMIIFNSPINRIDNTKKNNTGKKKKAVTTVTKHIKAIVKNSSMLSWIQMLIRITAKI